MHQSIFEARRDLVYKRYAVGIHVDSIVGGVPNNPKIIDGWLRTNLGEATDEQIRRLVIETMQERGIDDPEAATQVVAENMKLNGFKRNPREGLPGHDPTHPVGELFSEGRHIKAMLKEASNIAWPQGKWGPSRKGTRGWWSEHVFCQENRVYHGRQVADEIQQRFVSTFRGTSFTYEEVQHDLDLSFHMLVDGDQHISKEQWAELWLRAEQNGLGAVRSQSFGRFVVTRFDLVDFDD